MSEKVTVNHPGQDLLAEINRLNMRQKELAIRTGMSEKHVSTVLNGTKDISASFARKLDIALGAERGTWEKKQNEYDKYMAALEEEEGITEEELSVLKPLKDIIEFFLKTGVMHNHCGDSEKVLQLRKILCVNDLTAIPKITYNAAYRAQVNTSTNVDPYVLFAWQRLCEIETEKIAVNGSFDSAKLKNSLPYIKRVMFTSDANDMVNQLKNIFSECGIAFEVVHHFRGAPVQGFIKETNNGKVILCLTIRGKKADRFWFSLFHEVGHLLNGDLSIRFVDFETVKSENEHKADMFARNILIAPDRYKAFIASGRFRKLDEIKQFSAEVGVPYWITIGRLHSDEWIDWRYFANEAPSYSWADE